MSLILEALKKLEREKGAPDRGFLVMAATPWPARRRLSSWLTLGLVLLGVGAGGAAVALWAMRARTERAAGSSRASATPPSPAHPVSAPVASAAVPAEAPAVPSSAPLLAPSREIAVPRSAAPEPAPVPGRPAASTPPRVPTSEDDAPATAQETVAQTPAATAVGSHEPPPDAQREPALRLEAVSRRDGRPVAILSGRLVQEGDSFDNVRVLRIGETEVEIEIDGRRHVLRF